MLEKDRQDERLLKLSAALNGQFVKTSILNKLKSATLHRLASEREATRDGKNIGIFN